MSEGRSLFDGAPCGKCQAPLRVTEVEATLTLKADDGGYLNSSTYECSGPEKHRWDTVVDFNEGGMGGWKARLVIAE